MTHRDDWVIVNEVPTRIQTWGGWINEPFLDGNSLIIFFCGNPGLTMFYYSFLKALHQQLGVPVWVICHAGHEFPPRSMKLKLPRDPNLYNLAGQVAHKLAFVKEHVPANCKLFLIGHSMGAKIVSELLKDKQMAEQVKKCYLLMPTLERIGETPNGRFLVGILNYFTSVIIFFSWVFSRFPNRCRKFLINCWFMLSGQNKVDQTCMEATCHLTQPSVLKKVFDLSLDEMDKIKELDTQVLSSHHAKLKIYFAHSDGWAPLSYMENLKKVKPEVDLNILDEHFIHSFVLDNPEEMADLLAQEIKKERVKS